MKKQLIFITVVFAVLVLAGCKDSQGSEGTKNSKENQSIEAENKIGTPALTGAVTDIQGVGELVTIKEAVNKEAAAPNGDTAQYIYEVPVININKPGAQKINSMFSDLEKDMEERIGNGQNMTLFIGSKAFLNDGILSVIMEIKNPGPYGIHTVNYDIATDREIGTKELLEKYDFDPQNLIAEINRQREEEKSRPAEKRRFNGDVIDLFTYTIITNIYTLEEHNVKQQEIENKSKEEKERYVMENIGKIKAYINGGGKFVFIHRGVLEDKELVVDN
ncbi:hypothetical protein OXPF_37020 [Oxobacter pfennigii]|uniref:Lipoprotein n=1 Tax=Oxobacter pfennigii TaxID=36849 RepID=A0A0P8WKR2_9CLOT|nr:hypothetical protein [Oxobacter pfennigii]KPU42933.1 hypothetical protein OXPF_37020 [Oxobacter pfennigii]